MAHIRGMPVPSGFPEGETVPELPRLTKKTDDSGERLGSCDAHLSALSGEIRYLQDALDRALVENKQLRASLKGQNLIIESDDDTDAPKSAEPAMKGESAKRIPMLLRSPTPGGLTEDAPEVLQNRRDWRGCVAQVLEFGPPIVIVLNSITIAFDDVIADQSAKNIIESLFAALYFLEFLLKIKLLGWRGYFWEDNWQWNWFDFLCLLCALLEFIALVVSLLGMEAAAILDDVTVVRVFRLGQLMRTVRVLKFKMFSELRQITMGIMNLVGGDWHVLYFPMYLE